MSMLLAFQRRRKTPLKSVRGASVLNTPDFCRCCAAVPGAAGFVGFDDALGVDRRQARGSSWRTPCAWVPQGGYFQLAGGTPGLFARHHACVTDSRRGISRGYLRESPMAGRKRLGDPNFLKIQAYMCHCPLFMGKACCLIDSKQGRRERFRGWHGRSGRVYLALFEKVM